MAHYPLPFFPQTFVALSSLGISIQVNTVCPFSAACETTTFPIYTEDLVGMPEDDCNNNEGYKLPYARGQPFGIRWQDDTPLNCSIATLTIAIQAGFSCTGSYGQTSLNSYITPSRYRFPYENEYNETCYCQVTYSPLQVLFSVSYPSLLLFQLPQQLSWSLLRAAMSTDRQRRRYLLGLRSQLALVWQCVSVTGIVEV